MADNYLTPILDDARVRASTLSLADLRVRAEATPQPPSFARALGAEGLSVIAEVKRRSPSRGAIDLDLDPVDQARRYVDGGARAISVLTEPDHFSGSNEDLQAVKSAVNVPLLRKDFTVAEAQIWEARTIGASAILLIVAALTPTELSEYMATATTAGLDSLVEVHTEEEARIAVDAGARIIGVNNRNLSTFEVSLATSEQIAPLIRQAELIVGESGIWTADDAQRMRDAGYDAVLVGEALVRAEDPATLIREFRG